MSGKSKLVIGSLLIFFSIYLISCVSAPITYRYDKDKNAPIQDYTTYKIFEPTEEILAQMDIRHHEALDLIKSTIVEQMEKRNYKQSDDPDLLITYFVTGKNFQQAQANTVSVGVGFGGPYGGVGMSQGNTKINYKDYREGTLIIDFYNKDNKMVWHGVAKGSYEVEKTDVEELTKRVVKKLFQYYKYKAPKDKP